MVPHVRGFAFALLVSAAAAQEWVRVDERLPPPVVHVDVRPGIAFLLTPEYAAIRRGGEARKLDSTSSTGAWHELAVLPWGTVVVACDRGLFVGDAEHPVLDPADLRDGGPPGGVRSVAADARGRVWWCSEREFGVLDMRLRFGRVFAAADGLPSAPYDRLALAADGRVLLATAAGTFVYRPDAGPVPAIANWRSLDVPLAGASIGDFGWLLDSEARELAVLLRVRRRHHHLLLPVRADTFDSLRPGLHQLEVHGFDRDLRRVGVGEFLYDVPALRVVDWRWLAATAGAFGLAAFAWGWRRAKGRPLRARLAHVTLRFALLLVVVLQLTAAVVGVGRTWPFVGFTMYTETWREGDVLFRPRITGVRADGERVPLHEHEVGVHQDGYWQMLAEVAFGGDDAARAFFAKVKTAQLPGTPPFVGFDLADGRIRLTSEGPVDVAPTVLVSWRQP